MAAYKWRTKIQAYLAKIAGYDVETPKGTTREQQLMKEISDSYAPLPAIEEADEGKVLGVSDGKWAAIDVPSDGGGSGGGGVLVVGLSVNEFDVYTADKTAGEIYAALTSGVDVIWEYTEHGSEGDNFYYETTVFRTISYIYGQEDGITAYQFAVLSGSFGKEFTANLATDYPSTTSLD